MLGKRLSPAFGGAAAASGGAQRGTRGGVYTDGGVYTASSSRGGVWERSVAFPPLQCTPSLVDLSVRPQRVASWLWVGSAPGSPGAWPCRAVLGPGAVWHQGQSFPELRPRHHRRTLFSRCDASRVATKALKNFTSTALETGIFFYVLGTAIVCQSYIQCRLN